MFFLLSKVLSFLFMPIIWVFILLILAWLSKNGRLRRNLIGVGIIVLYFFSNEFICDEVYRKWEYSFIKLDSTARYDYAVVLGGYASYDTAFSRIKFSESSDRFIQAYQLYQQGKVKKLFLTGGSGSVLHQDETEADKVVDFLVSLKVPRQDIIMDEASRNTRENATITADWLSKNDPNARCLLITSASHLRRSIGCYKKVGVNFTPYATDRYTEPRRLDPQTLFVPNAGNLKKWDILLKEIVGIIVYKVVGYI